MSKRELIANRNSLLIGAVALLTVFLIEHYGGLERLEAMTLDLRFRHANTIRPDPRIVCIDIDDRALVVAGRWPWPRDTQAALIALPAELGAKALLVDITWSEPEPFRNVLPEALDIVEDVIELSARDAELRHPDLTLAAAIRDAGNVHLAFEYSTQNLEESEEFNAAVDALQAKDEIAFTQAAAALESAWHTRDPAAKEVARRIRERAKVVAALETHPFLEELEIADLSGVPDRKFLGEVFQRCRIAALKRIFERFLREDADLARLPAPDLFGALFRQVSEAPHEYDNPLGASALIALRHVLGYRATLENPLIPTTQARPAAIRLEGVTPAYFMLARAAKRCGFVVFEPDEDGIVRRVPLLARHREHSLAQIAFGVALDELGVAAERVRVEPRRIVISPPEPAGQITLQLDENGETIIPWLAEGDWTKQFAHIGAANLWALHDHRTDRARNESAVRQTLRELMELPALADLRGEAATLDELEGALAQRQRFDLLGQKEGLAAADARIAGLRSRVVQLTTSLRSKLSANASVDAASHPAVDEKLAHLGALEAANERLTKDINTLAAELRQRLSGKLCLLGYTATSLPDMKPTPTSKSAAGVMAHANLLNGLLTGQTVRWAQPGATILLTTLFGASAAWLATYLRPRPAFVYTAFLVLAFLALALLAFRQWRFALNVTGPVAAMLLSFFAISVYRFVFIDSERRHLATALSQYTSKEIARQVAENPELAARAETREVTAMFTDLRGFTTISEHIGAERTQKVLNTCLGRFVDVMLRHEAMVNKFIGDGIFAFWNPVIFPQTDHALRACETAIDLLVGLEDLKREQREQGGDSVFDELLLRVGVATGNAVVGPCGSEQKYDYTCIGDSVNLAARLESANKSFGTRILVAGPAVEQVGDRFIFRSLGGVQVKGKKNAVPVFELIGRKGQVNGEHVVYAEKFAAAVERFQKRDWRGALQVFDACHELRPDDLAAEAYREACAAFQDSPPPDDWNGAIELKEK